MLDFSYYSTAYQCSRPFFKVNGILADVEDFGYIRHTSKTPDYGCSGRVLEYKDPDPEILGKYGISEKEYRQISSYVRERYRFTFCSECE